MRPLAVLILVLGAAAALYFALTSITGPGTQAAGAATPSVARPADATPRPDVPLDGVVPPDVPVEKPRTTAPDRDVVEAAAGEEVRGAFANWLDGHVLDPEGLPVADAQVELYERQIVSQFADVIRVMNNAPEGQPYKRTKTDGAGYFRFGALKPGRNWSLAVAAENYSRKEVGPIDVPADGGVSEDVRLDPGFVLQGYVREKLSGAAVFDAVVTLENPALIYAPPAQRGSADRMEARTDERGYYRFANISPGQRAMMCMASGYGTQILYNINFAGSTEKTLSQDFLLEEAMLIAGRVMGPDRAGVADVTIEAFGNTHEPGCRSIAVSKAGGEFLLEGLNEGFYTLKATAQGWDVDPVMRVEAGTTNVEIQLYEQGAVIGKVVDGETGRAITDFRCTVRKLNKQSLAWGAQIAVADFQGRSDGSFQMGGISEGMYVIQGDARGYASSFSQEFTVTQGLTTPDVEVRMSRGGTLKGRVVDANTGEPIARADVRTNDNNHIDSEFTNLLTGLQPSAVTKASVKTDSDGRFEIRLVTPETYQVQVSSGEYTQLVMNDVRVGDGLSTDLGILELARGATVRGTVFGEDGQPAAGCSVSLTRNDNRLWGNIQGRTDSSGRFELRNAPAGDYRLAASRPRESQDSPFATILDMRNSEVQVTIVDGVDVEQNLYIKAQ